MSFRVECPLQLNLISNIRCNLLKTSVLQAGFQPATFASGEREKNKGDSGDFSPMPEVCPTERGEGNLFTASQARRFSTINHRFWAPLSS